MPKLLQTCPLRRATDGDIRNQCFPATDLASLLFNQLPASIISQLSLGFSSELFNTMKNVKGPIMNHQMSLNKFIMVILGCYLVYVILSAKMRLESGQIGTIFRTISEETLQGINPSHKTEVITLNKKISCEHATCTGSD